MFKYLIVIFNNDLLLLKQRVETPLLESDNLFKTTRIIRCIKPKYWYNLNFKPQRQKGNGLKKEGEKLNHRLTVVDIIVACEQASPLSRAFSRDSLHSPK